MVQRKKKILFVGEASFLNTGYSTYGLNVMKRLHATGKYEIAEFAAYTHFADPRLSQLPWRVYGNLPHPNDEKGMQEHNSCPANQFGAWRFEEVALDFRPDAICIPPGELVMTEDGYRPIEEVKVGDLVLTHKGRFMPVVANSRRQHLGDVTRIYYNGYPYPLICTEEHPVWIYEERRQTNQRKSKKKIYDGFQPDFVESRKVRRGDMIAIPQIETRQKHLIKIVDYLSNFVVSEEKIYPAKRQPTSQGVTPTVELDERLARLVGFFVSDGSVTEGGIAFYFGLNEKRFVDDCLSLVRDIFGVEGTYVSNMATSKMYKVTFNNIILSEFFQGWLGKNWHRKLPKEIWTSQSNIQKNCIAGLVKGDGCYKRNTVSIATSYRNLMNDYRMLCWLAGVATNVSKTKQGIQTNNAYCYEICGYGTSAVEMHTFVNKHDEIHGIRTDRIKNNRRTQIINNHLTASIRKTRRTPYSGQVYNLEVAEDNSYIVGHAVVHNCVIRDIWMDQFVYDSPFRQFYHLVAMPPVDSAPQDEQWIDTFLSADAIATYTEFGARTLREQSNGKIQSIGNLSPGADLDVYRPVADKAKHKMRFGFGPDINIVGTVMRNQRRKLFPDLFVAFKKFVEKNANTNLGRKTFLLCHTSYPDSGWDIPRLLKETGIGHKVLFTYVCKSCQKVFPSFFQDGRVFCPRCGKPEAVMPNTQVGVTTQQLAEIYNIFDVYVQYSIAEGIGMPQIEAAACGVPLMSVNYSGMEYVIDCVKGIPINVERMFRESETHALRALPDGDDFVYKLERFLNLPEPLRLRKGYEALAGVKEFFTYERVASMWEQHFDTVNIKAEELTWHSRPDIFEPQRNVPGGLSNSQLVDWAIINVLGDPSKLNSYFAAGLVRDLNSGMRIANYGGFALEDVSFLGQRARYDEFSQQNMLQQLYEKRMKKNYWEQQRILSLQGQRQVPDFIRFAKPGE